MTCAANASLNSTRSIWSAVIPAWRNAFLVEGIGPRPITWGLTPATPMPMMRASGVRPSSRALSSLISSAAETPSFVGQELPAVMRTSPPVKLWTPPMGLSPLRPSMFVPRRRHSSCSKITFLPCSSGNQLPWSSKTGVSISSGMISSL